MLFILITPVIYIIMHYSKVLSVICIAALIQIWIPIDTRILSTEGALFFYLGSFMACDVGLPEKKPAKHCLLLLIPICYGLLTNLGIISLIRPPQSLTIGLMLYVGWQCCLYLTEMQSWSKIIMKWNRHSFFLYALHGSVVSGISVLISRSIPHSQLNSLMMYISAFILTLIICYSISALMLKLFPKCHSVLSGYR